ncbi:MAG: hypothetical protein J2P21_32880, partial [Chloracidobacterium sp.]|nr:hypothetical protein [Chloracidobacterium sp.]
MRLTDFLARFGLVMIRSQARRSAGLAARTSTVKGLERRGTINANALSVVSVSLEQDFIARHIQISQSDPSPLGQEIVIGRRLYGEIPFCNEAIDWFYPCSQ